MISARALLYCLPWPIWLCKLSSTLSHKRYDFRKQIGHKMCVLIVSTNLFNTCPIIRGTGREIIMHVRMSLCKVP
jgi:hypothetical protein